MALAKLAKTFSVSTDALLFDPAERRPSDDLRLQFEALSQFSTKEENCPRRDRGPDPQARRATLRPRRGSPLMEHIVHVHIEKLPEGVYLATSAEVPGLVAQGRTITETLEIARDVAKKLMDAQAERAAPAAPLSPVRESFDYPLILGG